MLLPQGQHVGIGVVPDGGSNLYVLLVGYPANLGSGDDSGGGGNDDSGNNEPAGPLVIPVMRSEPREDGSVWHIVEQGQTAWDIALVYGGTDRIVHPVVSIRMFQGFEGMRPLVSEPPDKPDLAVAVEVEFVIAGAYFGVSPEARGLSGFGIVTASASIDGDNQLLRTERLQGRVHIW